MTKCLLKYNVVSKTCVCLYTLLNPVYIYVEIFTLVLCPVRIAECVYAFLQEKVLSHITVIASTRHVCVQFTPLT